MIKDQCLVGRKILPVLPCSFNSCPWYVHEDEFLNCFWVIAEIMYTFEGGGFTVEEIAKLENTDVKRVEEIIANALKKIRTSRKFIQELFDTQ